MDAPLASDLIIAEFLWWDLLNAEATEPFPPPPTVPRFAMETVRPKARPVMS